MAQARFKTMRVTIRVRHLNRGVKFGREFQACGRMMKPGRGTADPGSGHRQAATCSITSSPRKSVGNVLEMMAKKLKRKGHKRFGGK